MDQTLIYMVTNWIIVTIRAKGSFWDCSRGYGATTLTSALVSEPPRMSPVRIRHGTMIVEFPECAKKLWLAELPGVEDSEGEMRVLLQGEC